MRTTKERKARIDVHVKGIERLLKERGVIPIGAKIVVRHTGYGYYCDCHVKTEKGETFINIFPHVGKPPKELDIYLLGYYEGLMNSSQSKINSIRDDMTNDFRYRLERLQDSLILELENEGDLYRAWGSAFSDNLMKMPDISLQDFMSTPSKVASQRVYINRWFTLDVKIKAKYQKKYDDLVAAYPMAGSHGKYIEGIYEDLFIPVFNHLIDGRVTDAIEYKRNMKKEKNEPH